MFVSFVSVVTKLMCAMRCPLGRRISWMLVFIAAALPQASCGQSNLWESAYFRGTPNDWNASAMTFNAEKGAWYTRQTFGADNPRFKITKNNNWDESYPANDFLITHGAGDYDILFNDATKAITATKVVTYSAPISENSICFANTSNFATPNVYFWNAAPANSLTGAPAWPGETMAAVQYEAGAYYCYTLTDYLTGQTMQIGRAHV